MAMTDAVFFIQPIPGIGTLESSGCNMFAFCQSFFSVSLSIFLWLRVDINNCRTGARLLIAQRHESDMDNTWQ